MKPEYEAIGQAYGVAPETVELIVRAAIAAYPASSLDVICTLRVAKTPAMGNYTSLLPTEAAVRLPVGDYDLVLARSGKGDVG